MGSLLRHLIFGTPISSLFEDRHGFWSQHEQPSDKDPIMQLYIISNKDPIYKP